jgi:SAM-dependent methyltransferase
MTDLSAEDREREFHDALARDLEPTALPPRGLDALEVALLSGLPPLEGKRVLDLGCGVGDLSLQLLQRGAHVTGLDLSGGMVDIARQRAQHFLPGSRFEGITAPVDATGLPAGTFDVVVGKWILHHVELEPTFRELRRVMAPGASAAFIENSALNPLLMAARRHVAGRFGVPRYGTADEHPLDRDDLEAFHRAFPSARVEFPDFSFFRLFSRQVLRHRWPRAARTMARLDDAVYRHVPVARKYSFRVIVRFET